MRDARAIVHSYDRKYHDVRRGLRQLARLDGRARAIQAALPEDRWMSLRYEDFANLPEAALRQTCAFLGLDFAPEMLRPDSATFFGIGGNRMRKRPVASIDLDERWKTEMSPMKKLVSGFVFRSYNRRFSYET